MEKARINCELACIKTKNVAWLQWWVLNERRWGFEFIRTKL